MFARLRPLLSEEFMVSRGGFLLGDEALDAKLWLGIGTWWEEWVKVWACCSLMFIW